MLRAHLGGGAPAEMGRELDVDGLPVQRDGGQHDDEELWVGHGQVQAGAHERLAERSAACTAHAAIRDVE